MARIDGVREEIGWLKVVFAVCIALDASLISWLARNLRAAGIVVIVVAFAAIMALSAIVVYVNHRVFRDLKELEHL